MTIREVLLEATHRLELQRIPSPRLCAEVLLAHVLHKDRTYLYTHDDSTVSDVDYGVLENAIYDRITGLPVQYIVGHQEFYGRDFIVNRSVLIPRPETEYIIESVLEANPPAAARIVDVGTGSGCIGITLALELPKATVFAGDISEVALQTARRNASNLKANVGFVCSDVLEAIGRRFEFVVSNPPYVRRDEMPHLQREVRDHEPHVAAVFTGGRTLHLPAPGCSIVQFTSARRPADYGNRVHDGTSDPFPLFFGLEDSSNENRSSGNPTHRHRGKSLREIQIAKLNEWKSRSSKSLKYKNENPTGQRPLGFPILYFNDFELRLFHSFNFAIFVRDRR